MTKSKLNAVLRELKALKDVGGMYEALIERVGDGAAALSADGLVLYVNGALCDMLGTAVEDVVGSRVHDLFTPESLAPLEALLAGADETESRADVALARVDGASLPVHLSLARVPREGITFLCAVVTNLPEPNHGQAQLEAAPADFSRESARQWGLTQRYLDIAEVMLVVLNGREEVTLINRKGCEVLGADNEQIVGKNWFDTFVPSGSRHEVRSVYERLMTGALGPVERYVNPILRLDGEERLVDWHNAILRDDDGAIVGLLSSGEDITDRERGEAALQESEQEYRQLFNNMTSGVAVWEAVDDGADFILRDMNERGAKLTGTQLGEILNRPATTAFPGIEEMGLLKALRRVWKTGRPESFPTAYYEDQAAKGWFENNLYKLPNGRVVAVYDNVTARKQAADRQQLAIDILQILARPNEMANVVGDLLRVIKAATGIEAVGLRLHEGDYYPYYVQNGFPDEFVQKENTLCIRGPDGAVRRDADGRPFLECMCGNVLRGKTNPTQPFFTEGGSFWTNSTTQFLASATEADRGDHARNSCNTAGYESVALIPLHGGGEILGLLQFNDHRTGCFTPEWIRFFEGMGASIGIALARRRADDQLQESGLLNQQIIAGAREGIIVYGPDLRYRVWNPFMEQLSGLPAVKVLGRHPSELFPFLGDTGVIQHLEEALAGQTPDPVEFPFSVQDASHAGWVIDASAPLRNAKGEVMGVITTVTDITERKRADDQLRESRRQLSTLMSNLPGMAYRCQNEPRWTMEFVNEGARGLTGYEPAELIDNSKIAYGDLILPKDRDRVWATVQNALDRREPFEVEYGIQAADGQVRHVWERGCGVWAEEGTVEALEGFISDVTDHRRAEAALRERERILNDTGKMGRIGGWEHDLTTGKAVWTQALYDMVEIPYGQEPPGVNEHLSYYSPRHRKIIEQAYTRAVQDGVPFDLELQAYTSTKKLLWCRVQGEPVSDGGACVAMRGTFQDVTERKQAAEALEEQLRFRQMLLDAIPVPVFYKDTEGRYVGVNEAFETFFGVEREELVGKSVYEITSSDLADVYERRDRELFDHPGVQVYETRMRDAGGTTHDVVFHKATFRDAEGKVAGLIGAVIDVTEQKQDEEKIRHLAKFPAENPDAVLRIAKDGTLLYANAASGPLQAEWRCEVGQPVPESWRNVAAEALASGSARRIQVDCRQRILAFRVTPVADAGYVNLYARDITEHRSTEEQLRQAQKMEAIGHLAGGVAHDFRNQLTVINGYAEMLLRRAPLDKDARRMLKEILNASARSQSLTTSLLAFSRKQVLQPESIDVCQVISDLGGALRRMIGEDVHLHIDLEAPSAYAMLDRGCFEQALFNLITNARDAMPKGGELSITVTETDLDDEFAKHHPGAAAGLNVLVSVRDTGSGMDEDTRNRVFEPFFTTKPVGKGTGLGLSMVYGFVKQSNGHITVDSAPGEGAEFRLYFPRADASSGPQKAGEMSGTLLGGSGTILVVEDEESVRLMVTETLRECGYTVLECGLGREAMEIVARHAGRVEMLITDVIMPEMDGVDLAARITERHPEMKVLYMSGYSGETLGKHDMPRSDHELLRKPFHAKELLARVQAALGPQTP